MCLYLKALIYEPRLQGIKRVDEKVFGGFVVEFMFTPTPDIIFGCK